MPECARCGAFTDSPAEKRYHYCDHCQLEFDRIREKGIVVRLIDDRGNYDVEVHVPGRENEGGREDSQVEALARAKKLSDELGVPAVFEHTERGSQWELESYLRTHHSVRQGVYNRLSRVPHRQRVGFVSRLVARVRNRV